MSIQGGDSVPYMSVYRTGLIAGGVSRRPAGGMLAGSGTCISLASTCIHLHAGFFSPFCRADLAGYMLLGGLRLVGRIGSDKSPPPSMESIVSHARLYVLWLYGI